MDLNTKLKCIVIFFYSGVTVQKVLKCIVIIVVNFLNIY